MTRRLLLAPDKFRGTADQRVIIASATTEATKLGWQVIASPLSDGGEGMLDLFGGTVQHTTVTGPLGSPVDAEWRLLNDRHQQPTAVIEMARASGLALVGTAGKNDPLRATTAGTGELIRKAIGMGATRIIVGCGGSATTDGGLGAVKAIGGLLPRPDITLIAAADVTIAFTENARVFGPQKGASPDEILELTTRLNKLARHYREHFGVDVATMKGAGAAGGLAGGLAALGATVVPGFDLMADHIGLTELISNVDLVVTGEGRLDATSMEGKVVGELARRCANKVPLLVICGEVGADLSREHLNGQLHGATVISITERFGRTASLHDTLSSFTRLLAQELLDRSA